ncbi:MAG: hypothetical protein QXW41_08310 [Fervidicoccaceae archaeon]
MARRVKYDPTTIVETMLSNLVLCAVDEAVFTSGRSLHSGEVNRLIGVSHEYAYNLKANLEKRKVVEATRDPVNGKSMFNSSSRRVAHLLVPKLKKKRVASLLTGRITSTEEKSQWIRES